MVMFLWITPSPPSLAIPIAILLSVTVSMAALTIGTLSFTFLENLLSRLTSSGMTSAYPVLSRTSSKVRASPSLSAPSSTAFSPMSSISMRNI